MSNYFPRTIRIIVSAAVFVGFALVFAIAIYGFFALGFIGE